MATEAQTVVASLAGAVPHSAQFRALWGRSSGTLSSRPLDLRCWRGVVLRTGSSTLSVTNRPDRIPGLTWLTLGRGGEQGSDNSSAAQRCAGRSASHVRQVGVGHPVISRLEHGSRGIHARTLFHPPTGGGRGSQ